MGMNNPYDPRLRLLRRGLAPAPPPAPAPLPVPGPAPIGVNPGITPPPLPPAPPPGFVPTARDPYGLGPNVQPPPGLAPGDQQTDPTKPNYIPPGFHRWSDGSIHSTPEATWRGLQQVAGQDINTPIPRVDVGPPIRTQDFPGYLPGTMIPGTNTYVPGGPVLSNDPTVQQTATPANLGPGTPVPTPIAPPLNQHLLNHPPHIQRQIDSLAGRGYELPGEGGGAMNHPQERLMRLVGRGGVMPGAAPAPAPIPIPTPAPIEGGTPGGREIGDILPLPEPTPAPVQTQFPPPGTTLPGTPPNGAPPVDLRRLAPPFQPSPGLLGGAPPPRPNLQLPPFDPSAQLLGQSRNPRRRY